MSAKRQAINVSFDDEVYNRPFVEELQDTLRGVHDISAGPDEIHYKLINLLSYF